ncbi:unnamed protein product [Alternaria alternata]
MPAFAPTDNPLLPVAIAVLVAGSVVIEDEIMDDMVEETIDEVAVGIGIDSKTRNTTLPNQQHQYKV